MASEVGSLQRVDKVELTFSLLACWLPGVIFPLNFCEFLPDTDNGTAAASTVTLQLEAEKTFSFLTSFSYVEAIKSELEGNATEFSWS